MGPSLKFVWSDQLLFDTKLTWGQALHLFTLIMCGKDEPVETHRDAGMHLLIMYTAASYVHGKTQVVEIEAAGPGEQRAYMQGMSKSVLSAVKAQVHAVWPS